MQLRLPVLHPRLRYTHESTANTLAVTPRAHSYVTLHLSFYLAVTCTIRW